MMRWLLLFGLGLVLVSEMKADLTVKVTGLRNDRGLVRVLVFVRKEGFPDERGKAVAEMSVAAAKAVKGTVILSLAEGAGMRGVVSVFHDEDESGRLKKNLLGIPQEGVGLSGWDGKGRPKFERCVGLLGEEVEVRVKYF